MKELENNLKSDSDIFIDRILVENKELKVKIIVSGMSENLCKECDIKIMGLPTFSSGYSYANAINHFGKNIVFYKKASNNTIANQIQNSRNKVPKSMQYIVAINLTGPRFDIDEYADIIAKRFERKDDTNISGIMFVDYSLDEVGDVNVRIHFISNPNAVVNLGWMEGFFYKTIKLSIHGRY